MDVLTRLFEEHFRLPVKRVQPLQGELGGSGRKIIRLSGENNSEIGVLYGVREENVAFLEFSKHFRRRGLPVPEIYGEDLARARTWKKTSGTRPCLSFCRKIARARTSPRPWWRLIAKSWRSCLVFLWERVANWILSWCFR